MVRYKLYLKVPGVARSRYFKEFSSAQEENVKVPDHEFQRQRPEKYRHTSTAGREPAGGIGIYEQNLFNTVEALCYTVKFNSYLISKKAFWLPTNCRF